MSSYKLPPHIVYTCSDDELSIKLHNKNRQENACTILYLPDPMASSGKWQVKVDNPLDRKPVIDAGRLGSPLNDWPEAEAETLSDAVQKATSLMEQHMEVIFYYDDLAKKEQEQREVASAEIAEFMAVNAA